MSEDLFSGSPAAPAADQPVVTTAPVQEPNADLANLLSGIKNENGQQKYDSLPKALEGLAHAQSYIPQLKTELQQKQEEIEALRQELSKRASVEEALTRITAQQQEPQVQGTPPIASGLDEKAVLALMQKQIEQMKMQEAAQSNALQVQQTLKQKFGDSAAEVVKNKAAELGITPQKLGALAEESPAMVLALFDASKPKTPSLTTGGMNIPPITPDKSAELPKPSKSLLSGATSKDQTEHMMSIKRAVYAQLGISQ